MSETATSEPITNDRQGAIKTFLAGLWNLAYGFVTGKNTIKAVCIGLIALWTNLALSMAAIDVKNGYIWLASIPVVGFICTYAGDCLNTAFQGFDITRLVGRWFNQEQSGEQALSWSGVRIIYDEALRLNVAAIDWEAFTAAYGDTRIKVQAVPVGLYPCKITARGQTWDDKGCAWDNINGYLVSIVKDPTADNMPEDPNTVYLTMGNKAGPDALQYIVDKIAAEGKADAKLIKAVLCVGQAKVDEMKAQAINGVSSYDAFVNDVNPDANLTSAWKAHLQHDPTLLKGEADRLYWKYYKG